MVPGRTEYWRSTGDGQYSPPEATSLQVYTFHMKQGDGPSGRPPRPNNRPAYFTARLKLLAPLVVWVRT